VNSYHDREYTYPLADWMRQFIAECGKLGQTPRKRTQEFLDAHNSFSSDEYSKDGYCSSAMVQRRHFSINVSWSLPCTEAVEAIASSCWRTWPTTGIIDVCAGTGYWAAVLLQAGLQVTAVDIQPPRPRNFRFPRSEVLCMDGVHALACYPGRDVFMSWPPYDDPFGANVVRAMKPGQRLYFVGEYEGCTGDGYLFRVLEEDFTEIQNVNIPRFEALYDSLFIYECVRKESDNA